MMEMYTEMADHILIGKVIRRSFNESGVIVKVRWIDKIKNKASLKTSWEDELIIVADNHTPYIYYGPVECRLLRKRIYEAGEHVNKQIVLMAAGRKVYTDVQIIDADTIDLELYYDKIKRLKKEEQKFKLAAKPKPIQKKKVVIVRKKPIMPKKKMIVKVKTITAAAMVL